MIAREDLYRLIDELPEGELLPAERFLEYLRDRVRVGVGKPEEVSEIQLTEERGRPRRMLSPRFVNPKDANKFRVKVTVLDQAADEGSDASV